MTSGGVLRHGGVVGRRAVAGGGRFGAAGVAAPELHGHGAGPGGHASDRLGGRARVRRKHVGHGRFDRRGPGPGIRARPTVAPAIRETSRAEAEPGDEASQAIVERATPWERLVIGLERSWERARAVILEVDGRLPAAEDRKATVPPATGRQPAPTRPPTRDRTGAQARPAASSEAAIVAPGPPMAASFLPRPEGTGPAVDAALTDMDADRHADGPSRRSGIGLWDELAQARSPERTRAMVAMVASAAVASAGWTMARRGIRRRSVSIRRSKAWSPDSFAIGTN